jgi:hypothetical protein
MNLECTQLNLRGEKIRVEGKTHSIEQDGIVRGLSEEEGAALLAMPGWKPVAPEAKGAPEKLPEVALQKDPEPVQNPVVAVPAAVEKFPKRTPAKK